ncbi:39S ribosomal protein L4, mitochondrial-like [Chelonus insularis]|uniref:39S ribosomal protein L4, mitochondrial-like n=1 Tax=Chelonus insularis TaxID=460826 RepID=UPI00158B3305|nr:39S ribosomal protein L4, mitochondrial-like [Chelonus insularis]
MSLIIKNLTTKFQRYSCQISKLCTVVESQVQSETTNNNTLIPTNDPPIISNVKYYDEESLYIKKRQVWIDNIDTIQTKKLGIMTLHPEIFAARPRVDLLWSNVRWQRMYKFVNYAHVKNRAELKGGGRKPWPQKGLGRARHGSINSPLFKYGGKAHGPRSPATHFYMPPFYDRVLGLTSALSVKLAQDDLYIVKDLEIPTNNPEYIESLLEERYWGPSVLFVDTEDIMPENITIATDTIFHINLMPVYGLNVYSMLKHNTLVLTQRAARQIEDKLLHHLHRPDNKQLISKFTLSKK